MNRRDFFKGLIGLALLPASVLLSRREPEPDLNSRLIAILQKGCVRFDTEPIEFHVPIQVPDSLTSEWKGPSLDQLLKSMA
jgi:hypothetical protein